MKEYVEDIITAILQGDVDEIPLTVENESDGHKSGSHRTQHIDN